MKKYLLHGKFIAKPSQVEKLAHILLKASKLVEKAKGCNLYTISTDQSEKETIWVTEIWDSKTDHDNSLKDATIRELIMQAMPLLDGNPQKGQELEILGGFGFK